MNIEMGAEHKLDLTSDVTHLIVGNIDTPKYKYVAREREDVKVLRPEWVEAVRQAWMHAEELDLEFLEKEYKVPIFHELAICLTGFDDLKFRTQLAEQITFYGGEYRGDLTKSITHLIAYTAEGKKYHYAQQWGIKIVGLKWFKDSLERGMVLDEADYYPTIPTAQQGLNAWNREAKNRNMAKKRPREDEPVAEPPKKLRRSASARIGSQAESLWEDIVGSRETKNRDNLQHSKSMSNIKPVILEAKSFVTDTTEPEAPANDILKRNKAVERPSNGFLQSTIFALHGFNSQQISILRQHLQANDATVVDSEWEFSADESTRNILLVPYDCSRDHLPSVDGLASPVSVVTNLWLEKCLMNKQLLQPGLHALDSPLHTRPIEGFSQLTINSTAFEGIERLHVSKVVKTLGATYDEYFKPGVSILVSNSKSPSEERLRHAAEWNIPVVTAQWLWACVRSGKLQPWKPYAIASLNQTKNTSKESSDTKRRSEMSAQHQGDIVPRRTEKLRELPGAGFAREISNKSERVDEEQQSKRAMNRRDQISKITPDFDVTAPCRPLREISPNSPQKRTISPDKSKAAMNYDGPSSFRDEPCEGQEHDLPPHAPQPTSTDKTTYNAPEAESLNDALEQLLSKQKSNMMQRSNSTGSRNTSDDGAATRKKRLLGRAMSNLSNTSSKSGIGVSTTIAHKRPISRASSIDSMNTDGIGSLIGEDQSIHSISRPPSVVGGPTRRIPGMNGNNNSNISSFNLTGRASASLKQSSLHSNTPGVSSVANIEQSISSLHQDPNAEPTPQNLGDPETSDNLILTQLGYANPDDAVLLRSLLVDKSSNKKTNTKPSSTTNIAMNNPGSRIKDDIALMSLTTGQSSTRLGNPTTRKGNNTVDSLADGGAREAGAGTGALGLGLGRKLRTRDRRREKERERLNREQEEEEQQQQQGMGFF
ncbi:putative subunit of dna polymerase ii [Phaeomoniella chlamydospora]|uniref:Putative subunit of dna polymerase ii n=1 Tax=Phaeomoniella chlamydospora TaxID=158046 RepID=A0A0G2EF91_PHACM|nr:putative subunit of dna polymerase ii [Phaeomoniella chlamydospora]